MTQGPMNRTRHKAVILDTSFYPPDLSWSITSPAVPLSPISHLPVPASITFHHGYSNSFRPG